MNPFGQWLTRNALKFIARRDPPASALHDLPLVEVAARAPAPAAGAPSDTLAVFFSGDGGWAVIDRAISHALAAAGIPVVGFNSLRYFWAPRTPEGAAADLERILRHYLAAWNKHRILLIGFSRGAGVLPFLLNRLPADLQNRVRLLVLLAPGRSEEFEVRLRDFFEDSLEHLHHWGMVDDHFDLPDAVKNGPLRGARAILPELERQRGRRILCLHGAKEKHSLAALLTPDLARTVRLPGGHHFHRDYPALARLILEELDGAP